jgi:hypothetical protein
MRIEALVSHDLGRFKRTVANRYAKQFTIKGA